MPSVIQYSVIAGTPKAGQTHAVAIEDDQTVEIDDNASDRTSAVVYNFGPDWVQVSDGDENWVRVRPRDGGLLNTPAGTALKVQVVTESL